MQNLDQITNNSIPVSFQEIQLQMFTYVFCVYSLPAYFNKDKINKATLMDICSIDRYIFKNLKSLALFDFTNFSWRLCTCCTRRTTGSTSSQRTAGRDSYLTATPHSSAPRYSWLLFVVCMAKQITAADMHIAHNAQSPWSRWLNL